MRLLPALFNLTNLIPGSVFERGILELLIMRQIHHEPICLVEQRLASLHLDIEYMPPTGAGIVEKMEMPARCIHSLEILREIKTDERT